MRGWCSARANHTEARNMCDWCSARASIPRLVTCVAGGAQSMMHDLVAEHDAYEPYNVSRCGPSTGIGHILGGGLPLLREGGPISYQA